MNLPLAHLPSRAGHIDGDDRQPDAHAVEWLETDGRGGFAGSTVTMTPTRRYHGLLVAPVPAYGTRHLFLSGFVERLTSPQETVDLSSPYRREEPPPGWPAHLVSFDLVPWPRATHHLGAYEVRREIVMPHGRHAILVRYGVRPRPDTSLPEAEAGVTLRLRPLLAFREADRLTVENDVLSPGVEEVRDGIRCRPYDALPPLTLTVETGERGGWSFEPAPTWVKGVRYDADLDRGYEGHEDLFSPGWLAIGLRPGQDVTVGAAIDHTLPRPGTLWRAETDRRLANVPGEADLVRRLHLAADDFLYTDDGGRHGVLAGFPWFGEWGRDTFVALPGLTLARGRVEACAEVLSGALPHLRDGLLPNIYGATPADSHYGSVDASLWFARAVLLYHRAGGDRDLLQESYRPALEEIAETYRDGAAPGVVALGIAADEGMLVRAGHPDLNPTWMDAQVRGVPVTPRNGYPVEIEALWYSLLAHLAELARERGDRRAQRQWNAAKRQAGASFQERFWQPERGVLADVWRPDGVDTRLRPNMVLAASLEWSPLRRAQRKQVVAAAEMELLTPYGLRTLSPRDPEYKGRYEGGPEARDRAYHQGTVWPWLLGFFCEASLRVRPGRESRKRLRDLWDDLAQELDRGGLNHLSEVYDGDPPHRRGGTVAQAWNTAEMLRALALLDGTFPLRGRS
ncbi:MAG: amylo-alpha-1,6-glucosidase [Planctomycetota bacterium]|jgi:predicted glycogen debranching enzyme